MQLQLAPPARHMHAQPLALCWGRPPPSLFQCELRLREGEFGGGVSTSKLSLWKWRPPVSERRKKRLRPRVLVYYTGTRNTVTWNITYPIIPYSARAPSRRTCAACARKKHFAHRAHHPSAPRRTRPAAGFRVFVSSLRTGNMQTHRNPVRNPVRNLKLTAATKHRSFHLHSFTSAAHQFMPIVSLCSSTRVQ